MTDFQKLKKQTLDTDSWQGMPMYHVQPKDHAVRECTATMKSIFDGSIQIQVWFKDPNEQFPDGLKAVIRKNQVIEESSNFRIILEPEDKNLLIVFLVPKKYF